MNWRTDWWIEFDAFDGTNWLEFEHNISGGTTATSFDTTGVNSSNITWAFFWLSAEDAYGRNFALQWIMQ